MEYLKTCLGGLGMGLGVVWVSTGVAMVIPPTLICMGVGALKGIHVQDEGGNVEVKGIFRQAITPLEHKIAGVGAMPWYAALGPFAIFPTSLYTADLLRMALFYRK